MGVYRTFTRRFLVGTFPCEGSEQEIVAELTANVVSPSELSGTVKIRKVLPKEEKPSLFDTIGRDRHSYDWADVVHLVQRYQHVKDSLAAVAPAHAAAIGLVQAGATVEVVHRVLSIAPDGGTWQGEGLFSDLETSPETTDAIVAMLTNFVEKVRQLAPPAVHPSDAEDRVAPPKPETKPQSDDRQYPVQEREPEYPQPEDEPREDFRDDPEEFQYQ